MVVSKLFLIDDDIDDQEIFMSALEKVNKGVSCCLAENGLDALTKLKNREVAPDLIFLDLNMPVMGGKQFLKEIKEDEALSNIPIIIFSTTTDERTISETKRLGATDFISKPSKFSELVDILGTVLTTNS